MDVKQEMEHNYIKKLEKYLKEGVLSDSDIAIVDIFHDDWCNFNKSGICNCDPDLLFQGKTLELKNEQT